MWSGYTILDCIYYSINVKLTILRDDHTWALQLGPIFVEEKVKGWSSDVTHLRRSLRVNHTRAAYFTFTKGLVSQWIYVLHTISDIAMLL